MMIASCRRKSERAAAEDGVGLDSVSRRPARDMRDMKPHTHNQGRKRDAGAMEFVVRFLRQDSAPARDTRDRDPGWRGLVCPLRPRCAGKVTGLDCAGGTPNRSLGRCNCLPGKTSGKASKLCKQKDRRVFESPVW